MKIQACKVKNLFGSNDYCEGKMVSHIITVDKIKYIPFDFVQRTGFIYDLEDIEEIDYTPAFKSGLEPIPRLPKNAGDYVQKPLRVWHKQWQNNGELLY